MKKLKSVIVGLLVLVGGLGYYVSQAQTSDSQSAESKSENTTSAAIQDQQAIATFAGGCFWCTEAIFDKVEGVSEAVSGYSGGHTEYPTYQEVGSGNTGHTEAVQIYYDPEIVSYEELLYYFWRDIDPTDSGGQFVDRGSEYRPAIFYRTEEEKMLAEQTRDNLEKSGRFDKPLTIEIVPYEKFWKAESYHQNYHKTNPLRYKLYRTGSGRDSFLEKVWGEELHAEFMPTASADTSNMNDGVKTKYSKPDQETLKNSLTPMQYRVTQEDATEPPFQNEYWDNKEEGIYVDIVSGEPLFSSTSKYKSGTGWPSFWEPIDEQFIVEKTDYLLIYPRTELRSRYGDSHLGHVFNDGPAPTGLRYCINSASLRFVKKSDLETEGYGEYLALFN